MKLLSRSVFAFVALALLVGPTVAKETAIEKDTLTFSLNAGFGSASTPSDDSELLATGIGVSYDWSYSRYFSLIFGLDQLYVSKTKRGTAISEGGYQGDLTVTPTLFLPLEMAKEDAELFYGLILGGSYSSIQESSLVFGISFGYNYYFTEEFGVHAAFEPKWYPSTGSLLLNNRIGFVWAF